MSSAVLRRGGGHQQPAVTKAKGESLDEACSSRIPLASLSHPLPRRLQSKNCAFRLTFALVLFLIIVFWGLGQIQLLVLHSPSSPYANGENRNAHNHHLPPQLQQQQQQQLQGTMLQNDFFCSAAKDHLRNGGKVLFYNFTAPSNGPGMASLTLNMFQLFMYFHERWNRTFAIIDQEQLHNYRWNETHGLYSGFLQPNLCVLDHKSRSTYFENIQVCSHWDMKCQVLEIPADPQGFQFEKARRIAKRYYMKKKQIHPQDDSPSSVLKTRFFHDLSQFTCTHSANFRLAPHVHTLVERILKESNIPIDNIGLAFHIRRGDKVAGARKESRIFYSDEYVERFLNQTSTLSLVDPPSAFGSCFVATDDYQVVTELDTALKKYKIPCQKLYSLTPKGYVSTWQARQEILSFLAQLNLLVRAKYFVGSFQSNVGGMAALLRGCNTKNLGNEVNRYNHYYESYGVDWDEWGFL